MVRCEQRRSCCHRGCCELLSSALFVVGHGTRVISLAAAVMGAMIDGRVQQGPGDGTTAGRTRTVGTGGCGGRLGRERGGGSPGLGLGRLELSALRLDEVEEPLPVVLFACPRAATTQNTPDQQTTNPSL